MGLSTWRRGVFALALFLILAAAQSWPLPLHLGTHLTGAPTGDTGVYVWNLWVFRHEIVNTGATPFRTTEILPLAGPTDLSLHNYTIFSDLVALPLLGWFDIVTTFNLVYLMNVALAGLGMFLLARRLTGRTPESFLAGLLFAWSPFLAARGQEHFSLVAAAPLPLFMLLLLRAWERRGLIDAALAGVVMAWATFCDPYYGVYCVMLAVAFAISRLLGVSMSPRPAAELVRTRRALNAAIVLTVLAIVGVHYGAGGVFEAGPVRISMRTLYTPVLLLTVLTLARILIRFQLHITAKSVDTRWLVRAVLAAGVTATVLLSPAIYAITLRILEGRMVSVPVLWRSSAPGVDLLAMLLPNPNHALMPASIVQWLTKGPGGYVENVAALSWVGFAVILCAWRFARYQPGRFWLWLTIGFALLTLGPFLRIGGANTHIPTPWVFLRFFPIVGSARMPARFSVIVTMGFAVLFAFALAALRERLPVQRYRMLVAVVAVLLCFELLPAPRRLHSAQLPKVFELVAADPRPVRVLELPTGIRDGLSSLGNYSAATQFRQTQHGKGLIGGYLSRVSEKRKHAYLNQPVTKALIDVSEGREVPPAELEAAKRGVDEFIRTSRLGYVAMSQRRVGRRLRAVAIELLRLRKIDERDGYELFVPKNPN